MYLLNNTICTNITWHVIQERENIFLRNSRETQYSYMKQDRTEKL